MKHTYTISLHALNGFTVLPRLALVFSRRRLKIERLEMVDSDNRGVAHFNIVLKCDGSMAEKLIKQIQRIVEVIDVMISEGNAYEIISTQTAVREPALAIA